MKKQFLDLGKQPIANGFLTSDDQSDECFFDLKVGFDNETKLVSLMEFVELDKMFNDDYAYRASMSNTMREHFRSASKEFLKQFNPKNVLEIGSNDGVFLKNFSNTNAIAVEPCGNFSKITNEMGYKTYNKFWDLNLAKQILEDDGKRDLIFSANCICHIPELEECFEAISKVLSPEGVFIFEDPSLEKMIERVSYDQIYDEHAHVFSVTALNNILNKFSLSIFKVEELSVHGGSNRIYVCHAGERSIDDSVCNSLDRERLAGLDNFDTYVNFAKEVEASKNNLIETLTKYKQQNKRIVSYGATSKSTTVFNYCDIGIDLIDYIVDTTPSKQGKLSPGKHIPIFSPKKFDEGVDVAFLGAWNFVDEICKKEKNFLDKGGIFVSHIREVKNNERIKRNR